MATNAERQAAWRERRDAELKSLRAKVKKYEAGAPASVKDDRAIEAEVQKRVAEKLKSLKAKVPNDQLSESAKVRFDRLVNKRKAELDRNFNDTVWKAVHAKLNEKLEPERKRLLAELDKANEKEAQFAKLIEKVDRIMTKEEYRFLLGLNHPDRHPEAEKTKYEKAFRLIKRLEENIEPDRRKRQGGW